jgi:hypothetical protein
MQWHSHGTGPQERCDLGVSIETRRGAARGQNACGMSVSSQQLDCRLGFESESALEC